MEINLKSFFVFLYLAYDIRFIYNLSTDNAENTILLLSKIYFNQRRAVYQMFNSSEVPSLEYDLDATHIHCQNLFKKLHPTCSDNFHSRIYLDMGRYSDLNFFSNLKGSLKLKMLAKSHMVNRKFHI